MNIAEVIGNPHKVYEGDLKHYFKLFFSPEASFVHNPYHNYRHMMHVTRLCYRACIFYGGRLSAREKRNLLVAATMHDFNHRGRTQSDWVNIVFAVQALKENIAEDDRLFISDIADHIRVTEFPYKVDSSGLTLSEQIIRDADKGQSLSDVWMQQVVFGLAKEMNVSHREMLERQGQFLGELKFDTLWGQTEFPQVVIDMRSSEAVDTLTLLD